MKINSQNWDQHDYGYEVPACSRRELLEIANSVHKAVGYKGEGPFPILHLVENVFPVVYGKYDFMVVSGKELGNKMGETFPNEHVMKIREDIYDAACAGNAFARSTIGHEASHQIKHEGIQLAFARRADRDLPAYSEQHRQLPWELSQALSEIRQGCFPRLHGERSGVRRGIRHAQARPRQSRS